MTETYAATAAQTIPALGLAIVVILELQRRALNRRRLADLDRLFREAAKRTQAGEAPLRRAADLLRQRRLKPAERYARHFAIVLLSATLALDAIAEWVSVNRLAGHPYSADAGGFVTAGMIVSTFIILGTPVWGTIMAMGNMMAVDTIESMWADWLEAALDGRPGLPDAPGSTSDTDSDAVP